MGRYAYSNRLTVGSCRRVSTTVLKDRNLFQGSGANGILRWVSRSQNVGSVEYSICRLNDFDGLIQFKYVYTKNRTGEKKNIHHGVRLSPTRCFFGGRRWWFICPGYECNRRVRDLYLVTEYFLCRHCCNLTYESCRESHRYDSLLGKDAIRRFEKECKEDRRLCARIHKNQRSG